METVQQQPYCRVFSTAIAIMKQSLAVAFKGSATKDYNKKSSRKLDAAGTNEKSKRVKTEDNVEDELTSLTQKIGRKEEEIDSLKLERLKKSNEWEGTEIAQQTLNMIDSRICTETKALSQLRDLQFLLLNKSSKTEGKWFNDPVHGNIIMEHLCLAIIDTPEYQRLQGMKQLGVCDRVYRGATHTRFEHSLGVAHLAGKLATSLRKNQPRLGITDSDILCVKIAGLCHDLGHGPYSHLYDGVFIRRMHPNGIDKKGRKWRHEDGSVLMFQHLLRVNNIKWENYGLTQQV